MLILATLQLHGLIIGCNNIYNIHVEVYELGVHSYAEGTNNNHALNPMHEPRSYSTQHSEHFSQFNVKERK